jgi:hypothetical protein
MTINVDAGAYYISRLVLCPLNLRCAQIRLDCRDHARVHLVLRIEHVLQAAIEPMGPEMRPTRDVDQRACGMQRVLNGSGTAQRLHRTGKLDEKAVSPVVLNSRPSCVAASGSITLERNPRTRANVPSSSQPIMAE